MATVLSRRALLAGLLAPQRALPNIVLITIDDLGAMDVNVSHYRTPNLDKLATQGVRFTQAYAACAVCSPTRAAIQTGKYPARLGVTDWIRARFQGGEIPLDKKAPSGYESSKQGSLLTPRNALWMELGERTIAEALKPAGYTTCHIGKWHLGADDWYPEKQGYDYNYGGCDLGQPPTYFDPYKIPTLPDRKAGEYLIDRESDEASGFIRRFKDKPFFLNYSPYAVHTPLMARSDLASKYRSNATYSAMIESMDAAVGNILATLEQTKLSDRTLVIFTSDNGGLLSSTTNAPLRSGKGYPYEGGIRVPQIARWPGVVKAGTTTDVPVSSVDFFPTSLEVAQLTGGLDGLSLLPVLRGGRLRQRDLFWHFPHYRTPDVVPYSIIRSGDWKLIRRYEGRRYELFHLRDDPSEKTDLADSRPSEVKNLDARLSAWLKSTGAKMPMRDGVPA